MDHFDCVEQTLEDLFVYYIQPIKQNQLISKFIYKLFFHFLLCPQTKVHYGATDEECFCSSGRRKEGNE